MLYFNFNFAAATGYGAIISAFTRTRSKFSCTTSFATTACMFWRFEQRHSSSSVITAILFQSMSFLHYFMHLASETMRLTQCEHHGHIFIPDVLFDRREHPTRLWHPACHGVPVPLLLLPGDAVSAHRETISMHAIHHTSHSTNFRAIFPCFSHVCNNATNHQFSITNTYSIYISISEWDHW